MRFIPIGLGMGELLAPDPSSDMLVSSKEKASLPLRGTLVTLFGPAVEAESVVTADLGLVPENTAGMYSFTLLLDFRTFYSGLMEPLFSLWVRAGVAVGTPTMGTKIGDDVMRKAPLYSPLWLEAVNGRFWTEFEFQVFDRLDPGEVKYTGEAKVEDWGASATWDPPDFYEHTAMNLIPRDNDRIELVDSIRPERGYFVGIGSTLKVHGRVSLDRPGLIRFQAYFLLISRWNWTVVDLGQIDVYDDLS